MRTLSTALLVVAGISMLLAGIAKAGSLQVAPVTIEVTAPAVTAVVKVRNLGAQAANVQVRIFRWSQVDGAERLEPSQDVAVSPPIASLAPAAEQSIRIVRLSPSRAVGEESFRLLIDELPDPRAARSGAVALVVRHSVPVFFSAAAGGAADLHWRLEQKGNQRALVVRNAGSRRIRLAALTLRGADGRSATLAAGLAGYVLAGSTMRLPVPVALGRGGGPLRVQADSDRGPVEAAVAGVGN